MRITLLLSGTFFHLSLNL
uniref:Uncharacterized protein n=1 Tax=Lepeophtheirus salmonis TaxID=72036 RepID=A0A0K2T1H7_LEPSM